MAQAKKATKSSSSKTAARVKTKPAARPKKSAAPAPAAVRKGQEETTLPVERSNFTKEELAFFRSIIMDKKKEILEELETLRDTMMDSQTGEYVSENSTYSTHMEQGTDAMEREKMFLFASREGKFLNHLEDALKRIDRGIYGHCTECGKLIEKERLEAVPHAQQCLACKVKRGK